MTHRYAHHVSTLGSVALTSERTLFVAPLFANALQKAGLPGGLVRGRVYCCSGVAPVSLAVALVKEANVAGSWVAWCARAQVNWGAARHCGWALERVVHVRSEKQWSAAVSALAEGVELLVLDTPAFLSPCEVRRTLAVAAAQQCVVVVLGSSPLVIADVTFEATSRVWSGVEKHDEHGYLSGQTLNVQMSARRAPQPQFFELPVG